MYSPYYPFFASSFFNPFLFPYFFPQFSVLNPFFFSPFYFSSVLFNPYSSFFTPPFFYPSFFFDFFSAQPPYQLPGSYLNGGYPQYSQPGTIGDSDPSSSALENGSASEGGDQPGNQQATESPETSDVVEVQWSDPAVNAGSLGRSAPRPLSLSLDGLKGADSNPGAPLVIPSGHHLLVVTSAKE